MRVRVLVAAALAAAVAISLPAQAAPKTLDGKKVKKLTFKATSEPQFDGNTDLLSTAEERAACKPPRCARFDFVYKPAKGVKPGDVFIQIKWTAPVTDMDLFVVNTKKKSVMASCGAGVGTSETVVLKTLKPGTTYTVVADFYSTPGDTVTGVVEFPTKYKVKETVPAAADGQVYNFNCGLQG